MAPDSSREVPETLNAFGQYPGVLHNLILYVIDNEVHHRGQGYVYLRALKMEPPAFYDRSSGSAHVFRFWPGPADTAPRGMAGRLYLRILCPPCPSSGSPASANIRRHVAVDDVSFDVLGRRFRLTGQRRGQDDDDGVRRRAATPERGTIAVLAAIRFAIPIALQQRIGVQLQEAQLQKRIKVWEAVHLVGLALRQAGVARRSAARAARLADKRDAWFMTLSGGQKQRLFIALALINDPEVVFLDELTTGLDPQARRAIWELVRGIRERGKTVLLTTHLMEEAERLCDRVAIIDHGRIVDIGAPAALDRAALPRATVIVSRPTTPPPRRGSRAIPGVRRSRRTAGSRSAAAATTSSPT